MQTVNGNIACEPISISVDKSVKNGFATVKQKNSLTQTKVIFGDNDYQPGTTIYLAGDVINQAWTKKIYELNGVEFILVPVPFVLLKDTKTRNPPPSLPKDLYYK